MILGDLGAEIVKLEHPGGGDDTRSWGPPFLQPDNAGVSGVRESAYFLSVNRNKKSVCINMKRREGQALIRNTSARFEGKSACCCLGTTILLRRPENFQIS